MGGTADRGLSRKALARELGLNIKLRAGVDPVHLQPEPRRLGSAVRRLGDRHGDPGPAESYRLKERRKTSLLTRSEPIKANAPEVEKAS